MALTAKQKKRLIATAIVLGLIIVTAIGCFVVAVIEHYSTDPRRRVIRDPKRYGEWNRLRKEWNKAAAMEERRRFIMRIIVNDKIEELGLSEEERFRYAALVRDRYALKIITY